MSKIIYVARSRDYFNINSNNIRIFNNPEDAHKFTIDRLFSFLDNDTEIKEEDKKHTKDLIPDKYPHEEDSYEYFNDGMVGFWVEKHFI